MNSTIFRLVSQINIDPNELDVPKSDPTQSTITDVVLPIVFGLAGVISMLIIIIAGILFMLSRGDPQKSTSARNAIIYAAVGLVISVAAFSIVGLVAGEF